MPLLVFGVSIAYAQPMENIQTQVLSYDGNAATIQLDWSHDKRVQNYEIGCVSCIPNVVEFSFDASFIMDGVTAFPNSSDAMLYLIAYDENNEIINAKQILVDIRE